MKVLINITSYNRPKMLKNLLNQLDGYSISVIDDNSNTFDFYEFINPYYEKGNVGFWKCDKNYGKKLAWEKWTKIFKGIRTDTKTFKYYKDYDYFIFLPDDVVLCENFVQKVVNLWDGIEDKDKICMSFSTKERMSKPCFTNFEPVDKGDVILTNWTDCMFICGKEFINKVIIDPVDENRWDENPNLSSGVGSKISHFFNYSHNLYHAKEEVAKHIGVDSKMNKEERKINPL